MLGSAMLFSNIPVNHKSQGFYFSHAAANELRSLAGEIENILYRVKRLVDDLVQLDAEMDVDLNQMFDGLQEVVRQLHILTQKEEGNVGRPRCVLPPNIIEAHLLLGRTARNIAQLFGVCERTVRRRMAEYGIRVHILLTPMDDNILDEMVTQILQQHPNCGYRMMTGFLNAQGIRIQRQRVQGSMQRVDPHVVLMRTLQLNPRRCRKYFVPAPKSLWHIDGNHKLIRIERLWRDVYIGVLDLFYTIFNNLEEEGLLNPDSEVHLYTLHWCFLPHIQKHLDFFKHGWNCYRLWSQYKHEAQQDPLQVDLDYGVDWTAPHGQPDVVVPEVQLQQPLTEQDVENLPKPDGPLSHVIEVYIETVELSEMLQ